MNLLITTSQKTNHNHKKRILLIKRNIKRLKNALITREIVDDIPKTKGQERNSIDRRLRCHWEPLSEEVTARVIQLTLAIFFTCEDEDILSD
jgi:hypothetical protein